VDAHWSVLVIVALLTDLLAASVQPDAAPHHSSAAYLGVVVAAAVVFLAGLLAHEPAHALVARHYDMPFSTSRCGCSVG
jgi:Zn-dependent protease